MHGFSRAYPEVLLCPHSEMEMKRKMENGTLLSMRQFNILVTKYPFVVFLQQMGHI